MTPPDFHRYLGIHYAGAETPDSGLKNLRVNSATPETPPQEVLPPPGPRRFWCRRDLALAIAREEVIAHREAADDDDVRPAAFRKRRPELLQDPRCANNAARVANRLFVDGVVAEVFGAEGSGSIVDRLTEAQTAFGNVNSVYDLIEHPQLRTRRMALHGRGVEVPASPWGVEWEAAEFPEAPALDAHGAAIREEFAPEAALSAR